LDSLRDRDVNVTSCEISMVLSCDDVISDYTRALSVEV